MQYLTIAAVLKPQGIRGEVKVKVYLDDSSALSKIPRVFISGAEYALMNVRAQGEFAYLTLRGVADRNAAELLRGKDVEALKSECPPLPEGRYYIGDIEGCRVVTEDNDIIGEVKSVVPARTDIFVLSTPSGELSFAAAEGVILDIDPENKQIVVNYKRFKEVSV